MTLYVVPEVAHLLRLSESQVYALIASGKLRCYRLSTRKQGAVRVSEDQLREFLGASESTPATSPPEVLRHIQPPS